MEIKINQTITRDILENIFVTALEGGSNYWCYIPNKSILAVRAVVPKSEDDIITTAILKAVLDHDVEIEVRDAEDETEVVGIISKKTMHERLQKLADSPNKWALEAEIAEEADGDSSDIVFQYIAMGEVIYG
jgi:hypothetical protein